MTGFKERQNKVSATDSAARELIDAERRRRDEKTARLKALREAAEAAAPKAVATPKKGKKK